jgi:ATP-dependent RNA helicase DDX43
LFGSDEETSNNHKPEQDKHNISSAFAPSSSWNTNNSDTTKRVDWAKMRRTDTTNDMTKWKDFPPVVKEFYDELSDIAQMSPEDVQALRAEKNNIVVSWFDQSAKDEYEEKNNIKLTIPNPIYEFAHAFHNYPEIMSEIAKQGFVEPSPIQCQTWPIGLRGQDFIGIAQVCI